MRDELTTERLTLRRVTLADAPDLASLGSNLDIARMTGSFPHPFPLISAEFKIMDLLSQYRRGLAYPYAITVNGGDLMGIADIFRRGPDTAFELGYWIGQPFWGQAYVTEACKKIIVEAQNSLGVTRLVAGVFEDNPASMKVLTKLGFNATGETDMYFSMARLQKAKSVLFELRLAPQTHATPLRASVKTVIDA